MKLRRRMPALSAIASRLSFATKSSKSTSIDCQNSAKAHSPLNESSPPIHRNSVATVSLQGHLSLNPSSSSIGNNNSPASLKLTNISSPPVPNGKIIELINEVKDLTKSILIEKIGDQVPDHPDSLLSCESRGTKFGGNSPLIGSLCDLIERVWAHGAFTLHQDNSSCCPLWRHLLACTRLKYLDSRTTRQEFTDGSHLNVLSTKPGETTELDMMFVDDHHQAQQTNLFSSKFNNWFRTNVFKTILVLKDVKTDVGKARAFIKLSLERKKLSKHLKTLIGDQGLLNSLYKPYAFLRCEDEREQFLMYLLTLNAVDLPCFTSTFVSVINTRRMNMNKATI
jgi:hypothetical protein